MDVQVIELVFSNASNRSLTWVSEDEGEVDEQGKSNKPDW